MMGSPNRLGRSLQPSLGHASRWVGITKSGSAASAYSTQPPWLKSLVERQAPPPKLYAWSPANLGHGTESCVNSPSRNGDGKDVGRVYVVGVGNLGRLYASSIRKLPDSPPITLVVRRKELLSEWVGSKGIEIVRHGVVDVDKRFDIEWWTEEPPDQGPVREVANGKTLRDLIIGTKTSGAMPEVDRLRRYLDPGSTVAFLQNGMSKLWPPHGKDYVSQRFAPGQEPNFFACISSHGVFSEGSFKSVHASPVDAVMGAVLLNSSVSAPAPSSNYLVKLITAAPHLEARFVSRADAWALQLQKLVANCLINPLSAVLRCRNGILFDDEHGPVAQVMDRLLAETSAVLQALVYHESSAEILAPSAQSINDNNSGAGEEALASLRKDLALRFSLPELRRLLQKYAVWVKDNHSSMLQDVRAGKTTEIRDFNGWLVEMAILLNQEARVSGSGWVLDVSTHERLIDLVEAQTPVESSELARLLLSS